jgi:hypothetical protein
MQIILASGVVRAEVADRGFLTFGVTLVTAVLAFLTRRNPPRELRGSLAWPTAGRLGLPL